MEPIQQLLPEEALSSIRNILFDYDLSDYEAVHAECLDIILTQRYLAVQEYREKILALIDSQTHTSELGDSFRVIRKLIEDV
jgi:hypothetical protein